MKTGRLYNKQRMLDSGKWVAMRSDCCLQLIGKQWSVIGERWNVENTIGIGSYMFAYKIE